MSMEAENQCKISRGKKRFIHVRNTLYLIVKFTLFFAQFTSHFFSCLSEEVDDLPVVHPTDSDSILKSKICEYF